MEDKTKQFEAFSDSRLIDIVKNAKQFGYDDTIKNAALQVLKKRGITETDLALTGNLSNHKFDYTRNLYDSYIANSRVAFTLYASLVLYNGLTIFHYLAVDRSGIFHILFSTALTLLFLLFLVLSFLDHMNFYRSVDKQLGVGDQIIYFVIGMPFYIFMYFFYKSQMREELLNVE